MEQNFEFNDIEKEICLLLASTQIFDRIVNHSTLCITINNGVGTILPKNMESLKYFFAHTIDFFSAAGNILNSNRNRKSCFDLLLERGIDSKLCNCKLENLCVSLNLLKEWYHEEVIYEDFYFASFDLEVDLKIKRSDVIYICANFSKHNFTNVDACRKKLKNILLKNNFKRIDELTDIRNLIVTISDFYNYFVDEGAHIDKYLYCLAYYFNRIRLDIKDCLRPIYHKNLEYIGSNEGFNEYKYKRIEGISDFGFGLFWDLMNWVRSRNICERFEIMECWKNK